MRVAVAGGVCRTRIMRIAAITARNDSPFRPKHATMPKVASAPPAMSGPITRARLNWIELKAMAFGTCCRSTSDGSSDW